MPNTGVLIALIAVMAFSGCKPDRAGEPDSSVPALAVAPLAWEVGHPERAAWSARLRQELAARLAQFGTPADIADYCPGYAILGSAEKTEVLSTLVVAVAKRESNYKPDVVFAEPPPLNVDSIGLYQLSYEDGFAWCELDRAQDSLKDPLNNIRCAVGKMARLVERDGMIAAGSTAVSARGLARYWSVIREGNTHYKDEITARVRALPVCKG